MTRDKFERIGNICCEFQNRILAEFVDEPDQKDPIRSTYVVKKCTCSFTSVSSAIVLFLEDIEPFEETDE